MLPVDSYTIDSNQLNVDAIDQKFYTIRPLRAVKRETEICRQCQKQKMLFQKYNKKNQMKKKNKKQIDFERFV